MSASAWKKVRMNQFATIYSGTDYKKNKKGENYPIIGTGGIMGFTGEFLNEGPAVLTGRKGTIDKPIYLEEKFWNVDTIFCIKPFDDTNVKYFYYSLSNKNLTILNEATGVPSVSSDNLYKQIFLLPSDTNEQKYISDILSTCDTVIQNTQKTIEKYKAIKQGMMQDLFTRGLTKDGKLRPSYEEAPELYKPSELGMIPKEWEVMNLGDMGVFTNGVNKPKDCFGHGTKFVNISDVFLPSIDIRVLDKVELTFSDKKIYSLEENDILFVRSSVKPDGVGYTTIFKGSSEIIAYCGFLIRYRLSSEQLDALFLNYMLRSEKYRKQIISYSTVSANTNINQVSLKQIKVIVPTVFSEQTEIAKRLSSIDSTIQKEEAILAKYKNIKTGLMARLLTPPEDAQIIDETEE